MLSNDPTWEERLIFTYRVFFIDRRIIRSPRATTSGASGPGEGGTCLQKFALALKNGTRLTFNQNARRWKVSALRHPSEAGGVGVGGVFTVDVSV